jgi:hypothetical protein
MTPQTALQRAAAVGVDLTLSRGRTCMIEKVVRIRKLDSDTRREDLAFWLTRPPAERIAAVDCLRRQLHGRAARLQRTARVVSRA